MDGFRYAVLAVCITSAASALIGNLTAGTKLHKQMKLILDLVTAIVIVLPFAKGTAGFELPEIGASASESTYALELYNRSLSRKMAENVGAVLYDQIGAVGIACEKIDIDVNISDDGSIFISSVTLDCEDFEAAAEIVRNSLGEDTEVVNGNSGKIEEYEKG